MLSEEHCWNILNDNFKKMGFVHHQIDSFNNFINFGLSKIICEEPPIVITPEKELKNSIYKKYTIYFSDVYIPSPTIIEEDRSLKEILPNEARQRDLFYDSPIYVTITTKLEIEGCKTEIEKNVRVVIGRIPIMLRSSKCYLSSMTNSERIKAGECEYDSGGYFISKGKERVLIPQIRGIYNIPKVYSQKQSDKYKYIIEIRSMSEETGHSVLIKGMIGTDNRTIVFSIPYTKEPIPIGIIFKALGYIKDNEIKNLIGQKNSKELEKYINLILKDSYFCDEESDGYDLFLQKNTEKNTENKIKQLWDNLDVNEKNKWKSKMTCNNALKYIGKQSLHTLKENERIDYAKQIVEIELFPHLGITCTPKENAYFLGFLLNKLLSTSIGLRKEDDRDDYLNKRIESSGVLCYELFRQLFKKYTSTIILSIEKKKQIPDAMSIIPRLLIITNGLRQCWCTGQWGVPKNIYIRNGVSQVLSRLSYGATLSNLRRINIPIGKESKNSKIRQINPSQIMYICPSETPEGQSIGIVLNLALLTRISEKFPTVLIKNYIEKSKYIYMLEKYYDDNEKTKIFLNGILCGFTDEINKFMEEIKLYRKIKIFPYDLSISYDNLDDEINIFSDEGRLLRPLFIVENDKLKATIEDGIDWYELIEKGLIKYIDNNEINNSVVAFNQNELSKYKCDYCEIAAAMMLGVMASIIPFPDHSQSPRNCYQASMGKQAMSMFALSHLIRTDTITHVLSYPQKPIVNTKSANFLGFSNMPSGINAIVAIACYTGFNQEDSVIINNSAIERGLFWATSYRTHCEEEKKQGSIFDSIGLPPIDKRKNDYNYSLLDENGIVKLRQSIYKDINGNSVGGNSTYVEIGDVIIAKTLIHTKNGETEISDNSLTIKKGEEGFIDRIFISITPNGYKLVKIVIRTIRIPEIGDKFASRAAQKGTCGMVYKQHDMPFTQNGIIPDIIINPHCMPSRMTVNQLMESVLGKSCCIEGVFGDCTPFTSSSIGIANKLCERLGLNNFESTGLEPLFNGMTGEYMGDVFIGPVYYQRLKHLVAEKIHARAQGPNASLTRQPLEGRSRDGGLRFGEMERDCFCYHSPIILNCGLSVEIGTMKNCNYDVLGWNEKTNTLISSKQSDFIYKGERECFDVTFQDGRKITLTNNHKLLSINNDWIEVNKLLSKETIIKTGITNPLVKVNEEIDMFMSWSLNVGTILLKVIDNESYFKSLSFARIIGYFINDGTIYYNNSHKSYSGCINLGHIIDVNNLVNDLNLFCNINQKSFLVSKQNYYSVRIPKELLNNIIKLKGITIGSKIKQHCILPEFILDEKCPLPIVREFLGGLFGADGHTCVLGLHRGKRDILTSISFSKTKTVKDLESLTKYMNDIIKLLARFEINKVTIQKFKETTHSKKNNTEENKSYQLTIHLDMDELIPFHEKIGFRYCCHKNQRLEAAVSYKRLRNNVIRQHNWIVEKVDEITNFTNIKKDNPNKIVPTKKAIVKAIEELKKIEPLIHEYAIPSTHDITDHLVKGTKFCKFSSKLFPTAEEYLKEIGALEWFINSEPIKNIEEIDEEPNHIHSYGVDRNINGLPTMNLKVIDIRPAGIHPVYDIQVDETHSFLANGIVSHNCMIAHGTSRFLKERLCEQSDPYIIMICDLCGNFATTAIKCKSCNSDKISKVNMPYVSKLVIQELNAMMIKCKIEAKV